MNESDAPPPDEPETHVGHDFDFFDPNSPLARYYFQASHVLATLFLVAIFVFFNLTPLAHSDIWGHLKIGEWIVHNQRLPERELFSPNSDPTLAASNFQWFTQVIQYGTYRTGSWLVGGSPLNQTAGGVEFLRTLHALCEALKALFLLLAFRRMAGSLPLALGGIILVFAFSLAPSSVHRPQVFAEVLFATLLWILARPLTAAAMPSDISPSWRGTFAIAAILVLWVNTHGSFLIGIALTGLFWLGSAIESIRARGVIATINDMALHRPLFGLVLGVIGLSLLNPHGLRAIPDVLAFAKNPNILTMQEWKPLEFSTSGGGHWGYLALLVIITLTQSASPRVFGPTQLLLMAVFGVGPLLQERLMTWWAMLVPVIVVPAWAETGTALGLRDRWTSILSLRKTIIAAGIVLVGVVWSDVAQCLLGHPPAPLEFSTSPATVWPITVDILAGKTPDADDAKLLDANPLARGLKKGLQSYPKGRFRGAIFTPEAMGDYLVWSLPAKAPVMVYSHVHAFPPRYWDDYMEVLFAKPGWRRVLDRERVNLVVASAEQRRDLFDKLKADPAWLVILDPDEPTNGRANRLFAALRKTPLGESSQIK